MECYNKEKHHDLVLGYIKQAALENRKFEIYSRYDNYGNVLVELVINETDSILMKNEEFQEICNEAYSGITYHLEMTDYIAAVDESIKGQKFTNFFPPQGTTSYLSSFERKIRRLPYVSRMEPIPHKTGVPMDRFKELEQEILSMEKQSS